MSVPLKGDSYMTRGYSISPDSRWVAGTAGKLEQQSQLSQISIWDINTGITRFSFEIPGLVVAVEFHPLHTTLLAVLYFGHMSEVLVLEIRDLAKDIVVAVVSSQDTPLTRLVWSGEGNYLAGTSPVTIWEVNFTGGELKELRTFHIHAACVCFSPTNPAHILITDPIRHGTRLYDVWSGQEIYGPYLSQLIPTTKFHDATFSPDGQFIICLPRNGYTITIFRTNGEVYLDTLVAPNIVCSAVFLSDSQRIALTCGDYECGKTVYVWDINHPPEDSNMLSFQHANQRGFVGKVANVSFSPDGTKFLIASYDGIVHVRSTKDCSLLPQYNPLRYTGSLNMATFGVDNETYYVLCKTGTILTSSNEIFYQPERVSFSPGASLLMAGEIFVLVVNPTPNFSKRWSVEIHTISKNGTRIKEPYKVVMNSSDLRLRVYCAASINGLLALAVESEQVMIFDVFTGPTEKDQIVHTESTSELAFSPSGNHLAILKSRGPSVVIWDTESKRIMKTVNYDSTVYIQCMLWQNDTSLVVGSNDHTIYIESLDDGVRYSFDSLYWGSPSLGRFDRLSTTIAISPDRGTMISACDDAIIMWDLKALRTAINMPSRKTSVIPGSWAVEDIPGRKGEKWVLGPKAEHLFCLLKGDWDCLDPPGSTHVIKHGRRYRIDVNRFLDGEEWIKNFPKLP